MVIAEQRTNRIALFDVAKGIAIIAVVLGHIEMPAFLHRFIYLWHMLFFFVLAGYFFKEKYYSSLNNLLEFIKNKFTRLMIPYLGFNLLFEALHNFFINIHFYTTNSDFFCSKAIVPYYTNIQEPVIRFFTTIEPLIAPSWFLYVLFFALVFFAMINFVCKKFEYNFNLNMTILILLCLVLGYYFGCSKFKLLYIGTICSLLSVLYIGTLFEKLTIDNVFNKYYFIFSITLLMIFTFVYKNTILININQYYNPALLILLSIISFTFVMSFASIIKTPIMVKSLSYLGQNTIPILMLHCISFKLITYIQILMYKEPIENLAAFKTFHTDGIWWLLYMIVGIIIPLIINAVYQKSKTLAKTIVNTVFGRGG